MKRIVGLALIASLAVLLAVGFFRVGEAPYGNSYEGAYPCTVPAALPAGARLMGGTDPNAPGFPATMEVTYFPLGIICTVQLANPPHTEIIYHQSWPATIAWLGLSATAVFAILFAILLGRRIYRDSSPELS